MLIDAGSTKIYLKYLLSCFLFSRFCIYLKRARQQEHDICSQQSKQTRPEYISRSNLSYEGFILFMYLLTKSSFLILDGWMDAHFGSCFLICCSSTRNLLVWTGFLNLVSKFGWKHWGFLSTQQYHLGRLYFSVFLQRILIILSVAMD